MSKLIFKNISNKIKIDPNFWMVECVRVWERAGLNNSNHIMAQASLRDIIYNVSTDGMLYPKNLTFIDHAQYMQKQYNT